MQKSVATMVSAASVVGLALLAASQLAYAGERARPEVAVATTGVAATLSTTEASRLAAVFKERTGMTADRVLPAPLSGFVEIIVGSTPYLMDTTGAWLLDGHLVNLRTKSSYTAMRIAELSRSAAPNMDWRTLTLGDAIKSTNGVATPGRVLVTFEDPNCGFCRKLAPELKKLKDTVVFTFPISILGPASEAKNIAIWCSENRAQAWDEAMAGRPVYSEKACDGAALLRNNELARKLEVTGTPAIFFADGSRISGYVDADTIESRLTRRAQTTR